MSGFENHPVTEVTWYGAKTYAEWRGKRLPTEAEWEKAARGIDGRPYLWGEEPPNALRANYNNYIGSTESVGRYRMGRSPYGVYDMAGNVWEWVADAYDENFYSTSPERNPTNDIVDLAVDRVLRGGSWFAIAANIRSASRYHQAPTDSGYSIGFRCAMSIRQ